jgi:hypothetical protein
LVKNSIKINEKAYTDNNNEIKIGTLKNKQVAKVEFKVNVDDKKLTKIENQISLEYGYYMQADSKIQETKTSEKILTNYSEKCESNLPPIAGDDSKELKENTSITITPDISDPEGKLDLKSLSIVSNPKNSTVKIENGKFVYTPNKDYNGDDKFVYKVCDEKGLCDEGIISLKITEIYPPIAKPDQQETEVNTPVEIEILNNDTDPDNQKLTIKITENPVNGKIVITDGKAIYTPNKNYSGEDTFKYEICDTDSLCSETNVKITLKEEVKKLPPIAVKDISQTNKNTPVEIEILKNDSDSDGKITKTEILTNPTKGTATIKDNQLIYTPNKDYVGNDKLVYKICDNDNLCSETEVVITVIDDAKPEPTPDTDKDILADDDKGETKVGQKINLPILANDKFTTSPTIEITKQPSNGAVTLNPDKTITYVPNILMLDKMFLNTRFVTEIFAIQQQPQSQSNQTEWYLATKII